MYTFSPILLFKLKIYSRVYSVLIQVDRYIQLFSIPFYSYLLVLYGCILIQPAGHLLMDKLFFTSVVCFCSCFFAVTNNVHISFCIFDSICLDEISGILYYKKKIRLLCILRLSYKERPSAPFPLLWKKQDGSYI